MSLTDVGKKEVSAMAEKRSRRWAPVLALSFLVIALVVTACGGSSSDDKTTTDSSSSGGGGLPAGDVVIGAPVAETGWQSAYDGPAMVTVKMAVDDINKKGGIDGHKIKLVVADNKSEPELGPVAALDTISKGAKVIIASCDFDVGSPAALTAQSKGMVAMSNCAGSPKFGPQGIGPLAFTMGTAAPIEAAAAAEWAYKDKGWKTAYTLLDDSIEYDKSYIDGFQQRWKELAGDKGLVGEDTFKNDDQSIAAQITRIKSLKQQPDFIATCSYAPGGPKALRQIRAAGIDLPIVGCQALDGYSWISKVPDFNDFYFTNYASEFGDDSRASINDLQKRFVAATGKEPEGSAYAMGYSVIEALSRAIERAKSTDGKAVAAELEKFNKEPLQVGETTYDKENHISKVRPLVIMSVENSKPKFLTLKTPEKVPPLLP